MAVAKAYREHTTLAYPAQSFSFLICSWCITDHMRIVPDDTTWPQRRQILLTLYLLDSSFAQCHWRYMKVANAITSRYNQTLRTYEIWKVYVDVVVPAKKASVSLRHCRCRCVRLSR